MAKDTDFQKKLMKEMERHVNAGHLEEFNNLHYNLENENFRILKQRYPHLGRKELRERAFKWTAQTGNRIRGESKNRVTNKKMQQRSQKDIDEDYG